MSFQRSSSSAFRAAVPLCATLFVATPLFAQAPTLVDPKLAVRPAVEGLQLPIGFAFIGPNEMLVLEKNSGRVLHVTGGDVQGTALDLGVNFGSERGLLGIALHPDFPANPGVYLFWTCRTASSPLDPFFPELRSCANEPSLGADTEDLLQVPLLANRVDRFRWNGTSLTYERNLITLRAFQNDAAPTPPGQGDEQQPARGNHNGGVLRFGPDGKLYVLFGDQGRRGQLQNLPSGPTLTGLGPVVADDQFGGPAPDDAHLAGVILRLDEDGGTPTDNPFYAAGAAIGGEVGANIQRVYAYGLRNSFGMAFDPQSGGLWCEENGEDAFDELNRVEPGMNGGWIQVIGPLSRVAEFRQIETTSLNNDAFPNLQQFRWGPERIATTPQEARSRLFELAGSAYSDPEFSWKYVLAPAGLGFVRGDGLGREYEGNLFMGFSIPVTEGGPLFRMRLTGNRRGVATDDPRLEDRVADNATFYDLTESESLLAGRNFGVVTDIQTGPNGNLYVVSLSQGSIHEIFRSPPQGRRAARPPASGAREVRGATSLLVVPDGRGGNTIRFELGAASRVRLTVHDVTGRRVSPPTETTLAAGAHEVSWNANGLPRSVYFVRLETTGAEGSTHVQTTKAAVVR